MGMSKFPRHRRFYGQNFVECRQNREVLCMGHKFVTVGRCDMGVLQVCPTRVLVSLNGGGL